MPQPAKSAKLQLLQKNPNKKNTKDLKKRADAEERLQMKSDNIRAPEWLNKSATKAFDFLKEELLEIDLITKGDIYPLAMYCYWYSETFKTAKSSSQSAKRLSRRYWQSTNQTIGYLFKKHAVFWK